MEHQIELLTTQCDIPMYVCNKCGSSFLADEMSFDENKESDRLKWWTNHVTELTDV